ncbi:hypothetical protein RND81_08G224800 [Saponaria officinalis]|uniref:F-box domain-containing protein n=1 Tax=Saponaria officinalis TaxID=3572 RepID=A0AAW1JBF4_SAPOF
MEKKNKNTLSKPTLPQEIYAQILVKLPIKDILRYRRVSRLWRSIIDDPHFKSMHLKNIQNKQNESHLLAFEPHERRSTKQLCTIRRANTFRKVCNDLGIKIDRHTHYQAMGYVNGVLCLNRYTSKTDLDRFFLWNPSIKKGLEVPLPELAKTRGTYFEVDCALGYDPITNDFKIVSSLHLKYGSHLPTYVEIFTLSKNSWKSIPMNIGPCYWYKNTSKVYLNGVIYWMGIDHMKTTPKGKFPHMVSFDVNNEVINYINLPNCELINDYEHERFPIILNGSIALMEIFHVFTNIWVMKDSFWSKKYTFNLQLIDHKFLHLKNDGKLLFIGEKGGVYSYNIESEEHEVIAKSYKITPLLIGVYVESFMLLDGVDDHILFNLPPSDRVGVDWNVPIANLL